MNKNKQAFTLIELLVVVLIIGILAAVALPQYRLAVIKTHVATLLPLIRAIDQAQHIYYLSNGSYSPVFTSLDIELPAGAKATSNNVRYSGYRCVIYGDVDSVYCNRDEDGIYLEKYYRRKYIICWAQKDNVLANKVCASLSGKEQNSFNTTMNAYSYRI